MDRPDRSIEQDIRSLMPSRYTMWLGGKLEELVNKARDKMEVNVILVPESDMIDVTPGIVLEFDIPENKVIYAQFDDKIKMVAGSTRAHDGGVRPLTTEYRQIGFTPNLDSILSGLKEAASTIATVNSLTISASGDVVSIK